ncbi:MAG: hypothetical protein RLZZ297_568 [Chloroflexota bacterium]
MLTIFPSDGRPSYAKYFVEVLRSEGFRGLETCALDEINAARFETMTTVIVPHLLDCGDTCRQLCLDYVEAGGTLVIFHPTEATARALGIAATGQIVPQATMQVPSGDGQLLEMALHTPVARWRTDNAELVLQCTYRDTLLPAALRITRGRGVILAFAFDVAEVIALTRHGDPDLRGIHTASSDGVFRNLDLFAYQLETVQSKYPVLDLFTAFLANLVAATAQLPRLWYYPEAMQRSTLVLSADDYRSQPHAYRIFVEELADADVHCTFSIQRGCEIAPEAIQAWLAAGHTFGALATYPEDSATHLAHTPTPQAFTTMLSSSLAWYTKTFKTPTRTMRLYGERWYGYIDAAKALEAQHVEMDLTTVPRHPYGAWVSGSTRPIRYVDEHGGVQKIFHQPTSWSDRLLVDATVAGGYRWSTLLATMVTDEIIERAVETSYSPIVVATSPQTYVTASRALIQANIQAARRHGMPILSTEEWLQWNQTREKTMLTMTDAELTVRAAVDVPAVTVIIPAGYVPTLPAQRVVRWGRSQVMVTLALQAGFPVVVATAS